MRNSTDEICIGFEEVIDQSLCMARLHRIFENTHTRRRLKKWSFYLLGVKKIGADCSPYFSYVVIKLHLAII